MIPCTVVPDATPWMEAMVMTSSLVTRGTTALMTTTAITFSMVVRAMTASAGRVISLEARGKIRLRVAGSWMAVLVMTVCTLTAMGVRQ